jgi:hypothetical protein
MKNADAPAVKREEEEKWGNKKRLDPKTRLLFPPLRRVE